MNMSDQQSNEPMNAAAELSTDVVVLGAGLAGFCAAPAAAEAGAQVVLLEKMPRHGGSTIQSGGSFAFAGTDAQRAAGIDDSAERLRVDLPKAGAHKNEKSLVDVYAEMQLEAYRWLKAHGVAFGPKALSSSMSAPRTHPVNPVLMRGERFVDEWISYKTIGDACLKQQDGVGFQIFDDRIMQKSSPLPTSNDFRRAEREGLLRKAETLEGLAAELKLDPEKFTSTVKRYNDGVAVGVDAEFGRTGLGSGYGERLRIEVPPFYGFSCMTSVLATYCGLSVDRSMKLLNAFDEPIPGVFAAAKSSAGFMARTT